MIHLGLEALLGVIDMLVHESSHTFLQVFNLGGIRKIHADPFCQFLVLYARLIAKPVRADLWQWLPGGIRDALARAMTRCEYR
jgi:hypothetical protein